MNASAGSHPWVWWCSVAGFALGLRILMAPFPYTPDESVYVQHAWNLARGMLNLDDSSWYIHRIPVYQPTGMIYGLFGLSYWSTMAWPLLVAVAQILLTMVFVRRIVGPGADLVAGMLVAVLPLDVLASLHLHADGAFGLWMSASVVAWWMADKDLPRRHRTLLLAAAGIALATAVLIRPYAGILVVVFAADLWLDRRPVRDAALVFAGAAPPILAYLAIYQLATGDAFYRIQVISETYADGGLAEPARLLFYPRAVLHPGGPYALHGLLAVAAAVVLVASRARRSDVRLLVWIAAIAAFLQFGTMSLDSWLPILKRARFLTPLTVPVCAMIAIALWRLGEWSARFGPLSGRVPLARAGLSALVILVAAGAGWRHLDGVRRIENARSDAWVRVASLIQAERNLPVYVDHWRTAIQLGPHVSFFGGRGFYFDDVDSNRMREGAFDSGGRLGYLSAPGDFASPGVALVLIDRSDGRGVENVDHLPNAVSLMEEAGLELYRLTPVTAEHLERSGMQE